MSVAAVAARLRAGELTPREATQAYLDRIAALDESLNAYLQVLGEEALAEADRVAALPGRGPLWGVPIGIKDVIDVAGARTTAASRILAGNVASRDAGVVERLRGAGAVILGKINTHEFAFGAMTTSPHFGPSRNPWDTDRICGGSSGGSGAATAADLAAGTLGTDTAGSVRIPSGLCGVTGIRPSSGRVSNRGVVPVSMTLDTVGPLARTAEDCALILEAIAGQDAGDQTTVAAPVPRYSEQIRQPVDGIRIGVIGSLLDGSDPRIAAAVEAALDELRALGAAVDRVEVPNLELAGTICQLVMLPEAAEVHLPWLRERLADYGADVRARLLAGLVLPATAAVTGQRARRWFADGVRELHRRYDVLVAPELPVVAPRIGEDTVETPAGPILYRLAIIPHNSPWALIGVPAASTPAGFVDGLPCGMAIVGRRLEEGTVLRVAHALQQVTDWHLRRPDLGAAPAPPV